MPEAQVQALAVGSVCPRLQGPGCTFVLCWLPGAMVLLYDVVICKHLHVSHHEGGKICWRCDVCRSHAKRELDSCQLSIQSRRALLVHIAAGACIPEHGDLHSSCCPNPQRRRASRGGSAWSAALSPAPVPRGAALCFGYAKGLQCPGYRTRGSLRAVVQGRPNHVAGGEPPQFAHMQTCAKLLGLKPSCTCRFVQVHSKVLQSCD